MPNRNYLNGANAERAYKKHLIQLDKDTLMVVRSAGSLGHFDLWALFPTYLALISVKRAPDDTAAKRILSAEAKRLHPIKVPHFAKKVIAVVVPRKGWLTKEVK